MRALWIRLILTLPMFSGCAVPTTYGMLTDGLQPLEGQANVTPFGGASAGVEQAGGGGLSVETPPVGRTSFAFIGGYASHESHPLAGLGMESRYRIARDADAPAQGMFMSGLGYSQYPHEDISQLGVHGGVLGSYRVGPLRPYLGAKFNVAANGWLGIWGMGTAGLSVSPVKDRRSLSLAGEVSVIEGSNEDGRAAVLPMGYFRLPL